MDSHNHMKSDCIVCGKECLPLYTKGYGIDQVSFCSEECLKKQLEICNLKSGVRHTCYECDKEFDAHGVSDHIGFTYCSTDCAYRFNGVTQHIYEKGHEDGNMKTCEGSLKEKCAACGTVCMPKYTIGYGLGQKAFCSEQCLREWAEILDIEDEWNKVFTCLKCGKTFWHGGVRDRACHYFCSTDCAYRYKGVAQYEVVNMDKEKEQQNDARVKNLLVIIDELQKQVNSLTGEVESKEKEIKRIRSKMDLSTLEPLLDKLPAIVLNGESVMDEMGENMAVLSILGLEELVSKLQDAIKATHDAGSELFDKIKELKES